MKPSPITKKYLFAVARQEMDEWLPSVNRGFLMAILFCFIHRLTTGERFEQTFMSPPLDDYQI